MNTLITIVCLVALTSLAVRFVITVLDKWGILEWMQSRSNEFFHKLLTCSFCRSFWTAAILCIVAFIISGYWPILIVPIFVAPLGI